MLYRHVPRELVERPKMGFGMPLANGCAARCATGRKTLLAERGCGEGGFFDPRSCVATGPSTSAAGAIGQYLLWGVLMFEAWRERWGRLA